MRRFFPFDVKEGKPLAMKGLAEGLRRISQGLENMQFLGGHIEWRKGYIPVFVIDKALMADVVTTDTEATETLTNKRRSIENTTDPQCIQIYDFDGNTQVEDALPDLMEADPDTGELTAKTGADKYEMLVRVSSEDGSRKVVGYMSIAPPSNPADPTDPSNFEDDCGSAPYEGGLADGVYGDTSTGSSGEFVSAGGGQVGDGSTESMYNDYSNESNDDSYAGKSNRCW